MTATPPTPAAWNWSADELREAGYRIVDVIADYLSGLPRRSVFRPYPADKARALAAEPVPEAGAPVDALLDDFLDLVAPYPFGNGHPRFWAWVNSPPHPVGVAAEALAASMNPSVAGGNHAAVHIEHQVVRWFAELAGFGAGSTGLLTSGGSMAILNALTVARHRAAARAGIDVRADGLQGHDRRFVFYLSDEGHGSARKAAELLGIGSASIRTVPTDEHDRMRPEALREQLDRDLADGHLPFAVMATVGTVNTGAIDPLETIADICTERGIWLHIDGSYGAPAVLLLDEHETTRAALQRVDSIAMDPHKWLYAPVDAGLVLIRDGETARDAFSLVPPYLRTDDDADGVRGPVWFSEYGFDQTRPFRALKVWMLLKHLGTTGYRDLITHDIAIADHLAAAVTAAPDLELLANGLSVVCFRCRPADWTDGDQALDELNRHVLSAVQTSGRAFLAGTTIRGAFALRACVVNPGSGTHDVDAVLSEIRATLARTMNPDPVTGSPKRVD